MNGRGEKGGGGGGRRWLFVIVRQENIRMCGEKKQMQKKYWGKIAGWRWSHRRLTETTPTTRWRFHTIGYGPHQTAHDFIFFNIFIYFSYLYIGCCWRNGRFYWIFFCVYIKTAIEWLLLNHVEWRKREGGGKGWLFNRLSSIGIHIFLCCCCCNLDPSAIKSWTEGEVH